MEIGSEVIYKGQTYILTNIVDDMVEITRGIEINYVHKTQVKKSTKNLENPRKM